MKISINTEVLKKERLSLGELLVLLMGFYEIDFELSYNKLVTAGIINPNLFNKTEIVLSNNTKDWVAKILMESDDKAINSDINFDSLAKTLQELYPSGYKPGTTYSWRDRTDVIAQKLRTLVVKYDFTFTEEEAIKAVKEYVESFYDLKCMQLLKYFILKTTDDGSGHKEINSMFMTIIENNR